MCVCTVHFPCIQRVLVVSAHGKFGQQFHGDFGPSYLMTRPQCSVHVLCIWHLDLFTTRRCRHLQSTQKTRVIQHNTVLLYPAHSTDLLILLTQMCNWLKLKNRIGPFCQMQVTGLLLRFCHSLKSCGLYLHLLCCHVLMKVMDCWQLL